MTTDKADGGGFQGRDGPASQERHSDPAMRAEARARIAESLTLAQSGNLAAARIMLDAIGGDAALVASAGLGPLTVAGLPRKLHSAYLKLAKIGGDPATIAGLQFTMVPESGVFGALGVADAATRAAIIRASRDPIPAILHQIWIGTLDVPPATEAWRAHCRRAGLEYRLWREADLAQHGFDADPAFRDMLSRCDYPGAVDVLRYLILYRFGGIYLDCDWYPAREDGRFADCVPSTGLAAMAEDIPRQTGTGGLMLANSFIAGPAGHPVFARLCDAVSGLIAAMPDAPAWWVTGPLAFTIASRPAPVTVMPPDFVAANLPRQADFTVVEDIRRKAAARGAGMLIGWKSW